MKKLRVAGALALGCWSGAAQAATTIEFNGGGSGVPTGLEVFEDFERYAAGTPGASIGTNAYVLSEEMGDSAGNLGVRPAFGSTGNFAAVWSFGEYSVNFTATNAFSFVLGSLDSFNVLTLRYDDGTSFTYQGGAIIDDLLFDSGNRTSEETNGVVTYRVSAGPLITGATFGSLDGNSFEVDNLATAVPEPAAWGMMIMGFGLVGGVLRRRPQTKVTFA